MHVSGRGFWATCMHPSVPLADLSTGELERAGTERFIGSACGTDGKLFKAKTPEPVDLETPEPNRPERARVSWWWRMLWHLWRWARSRG